MFFFRNVTPQHNCSTAKGTKKALFLFQRERIVVFRIHPTVTATTYAATTNGSTLQPFNDESYNAYKKKSNRQYLLD